MAGGQFLDFQRHLFGRGLRRRRLLLEFPADNRMHERAGRGLAHRTRCNLTAIPQDCHAIGDAKHLIETVGHVDDADPILLHAMKHAEEAGDVGLRKRRRRLVENEKVGADRERARNRNNRLPRRV